MDDMCKQYLLKVNFLTFLKNPTLSESFVLYIALIIWLLQIFACVDDVGAAEAAITVFQNAIINNYLMMNFQAEGIFTEKVIKFLDRGFTVKVEYNIELWRKRAYWFDHLDSQHNIGYQINYNLLEKRYTCLKTQDGVDTDSKQDRQRTRIIEWVTRPTTPLSVISVDQLDQKFRYYYNIEILMVTLTSENVKDLQKWLGEFEKKGDEPSTITKTTFKVAADFISSRNHRKLSARLEQFYLRELPELDK